VDPPRRSTYATAQPRAPPSHVRGRRSARRKRTREAYGMSVLGCYEYRLQAGHLLYFVTASAGGVYRRLQKRYRCGCFRLRLAEMPLCLIARSLLDCAGTTDTPQLGCGSHQRSRRKPCLWSPTAAAEWPFRLLRYQQPRRIRAHTEDYSSVSCTGDGCGNL